MFGLLSGGSRIAGMVSVVLMVMALSACGSKSLNRAPVEDRGSAHAAAVKQPPGFENAGKAGYYTVKPGDTLIRIGLETGQSRKDITRWNSLDNPDKIEVGQVLRVAPPLVNEPAPAVAPVAVAVTKPVTSSTVTATPIGPGQTKPAAAPAAPAATPASAPAAAPASTTAAAAATNGDDEPNWVWPANGAVLAGFDETKNKGLDIGGKEGDAVLAAADGRVVYAGAGLRGYGNLIILKHNNTYLTAYAHNKTLLVKEEVAVKKGQKIAEMGDSDADRVKLHFEVRKQGKPVDPAKYMPNR